jgi:NADPH-dependent 2,4-dienoyl-CoA reductase/sulfur reductase-like enzyme
VKEDLLRRVKLNVDKDSDTHGPRILIVGGVAGGASCATRARRLSEKAEIIIFERGPYVSFANCGLPYYVGDIITEEENLLVATPNLFRDRFNIEVRTQSNVVSIDREKQEIEVTVKQAEPKPQEPTKIELNIKNEPVTIKSEKQEIEIKLKEDESKTADEKEIREKKKKLLDDMSKQVNQEVESR